MPNTGSLRDDLLRWGAICPGGVGQHASTIRAVLVEECRCPLPSTTFAASDSSTTT